MIFLQHLLETIRTRIFMSLLYLLILILYYEVFLSFLQVGAKYFRINYLISYSTMLEIVNLVVCFSERMFLRDEFNIL